MSPWVFTSDAKAVPFTFTVRLDEAFSEGLQMDCASEAAAIDAAREILQARIDDQPRHAGAARRGVVGVGIGSWLTERDLVVWLGEWEWSAAEGWTWTSSD